MVGGEGRPAISFRRVAYIETDLFVLRQNGEIEIAHLRIGVVAVQSGNRVRQRRSRGEQVIRIRDAVEISIVLEAAISAFKPIPSRLLHAYSHVAVRVRAPTA